jgi:hypothetical protein
LRSGLEVLSLFKKMGGYVMSLRLAYLPYPY